MLIETIKTMRTNDDLQNNDVIGIGDHNGRETALIDDYLISIEGE